jgi:uncharacterized protein YegP (UPF0339 family)
VRYTENGYAQRGLRPGRADEAQTVAHEKQPSYEEQPEEEMDPVFRIHRASNNELYFVLEAENGKAILSSEMYMRKESVLEGIESVRTNAPKDERFVRKTENSGKPYFVLVAANKEPIGTSEAYSSKKAMEQGIASVKKNAPKATVVDESGEKHHTDY